MPKRLTSYEKVMRELTKMKKQYDRQEARKSAREEAKNERAAFRLAKMEGFDVYSDDRFDASEVGMKPSYSEGGWE